MNKSDNISELAAALVMAQPTFKTALMESTNPFFKSKYADLGAVWEAVHVGLKTHGLTVTQFPDAIGEKPALTTILLHESGQWISGIYPLIVSSKDETAQGFGSAMTYARRYGLSAVLGVIADTDDDGNAASQPPKPAPQPTRAEKGDALDKARTWANEAIREIQGLTDVEVDAWTAKNAAAMVKLRNIDADTHSQLMTAIQKASE